VTEKRPCFAWAALDARETISNVAAAFVLLAKAGIQIIGRRRLSRGGSFGQRTSVAALDPAFAGLTGRAIWRRTHSRLKKKAVVMTHRTYRRRNRSLRSTRLLALTAFAGLFGLASPSLALDKVKFGTNWLADPEAGGFYQSVADGTYAKYGLDVTIIPGGPQSNGALLLLFGKIEFFMGGDMIGNFLSVEGKLPLIAVAADFQKSPQILMSHPGQGLDRWKDLPKANPVYLGAGAIQTFYAWLRIAYGFKDENIRPYNFNSAPFIANKGSIQQGYITAEPYAIEKQGHFKPNVFLLSDHGYDTYSTLIVTRTGIIEKNPDLVQRFVDASAIGWYHYLYGDSSKANALIKRDNPDINDDEIAYSIGAMKRYGVVDSGDALRLGIGAMTDARWKDFFDKMAEAGVADPRDDYKKAYTLQFVNKSVGVGLRLK
jgi:NitT/TauT family transport system substrate-binding protein